MFKTFLKTTSLLSSVFLTSHLSSNLTSQVINSKINNKEAFYNSISQNLLQYSGSVPHSFTEKIMNGAKYVNEKIAEQDEIQKFNSQKKYINGHDKVEWNFPAAEIWVTKAYLGNVSTILGLSGASTFVIIAIISIILSVKGVALGGPIGGVIGAIIGILYGGATAFLMNKVNSYKYGGYFKADYSIAFTPITLMSTLREQTIYETAPRVKPLASDINYGHSKNSFDFDYIDQTKAKIWIDWDLNWQNYNFYGVIDLSRYNRNLKFRTIENIRARLFYTKSFSIIDSKFQSFIKSYFTNKSNDYLFVKLNEDQRNYNFEIGGSLFDEKGNHSQNEWVKRQPHSLNGAKIQNLGMFIEIDFYHK